MDRLVTLLPYILPPLLGAVIGYITNALAIRMLFRPLTEKRILGVRIPLTPGIIPKRRYQLAESIANMVSQKLLTEEVVLEKVSDPEFREKLHASVANLSGDLLEGTDAVTQDEPPGVGGNRRGTADLTSVVRELLSSFFAGPRFQDTVGGLARKAVAGVLGMKAGAVIPDQQRMSLFTQHLLNALVSGRSADAALDAVQRWVSFHLRENTPLRDVIGRRSVTGVLRAIPLAYDPIVEMLLSFLKHHRTREELSVHGRELLKRILKRLNLFQRLLVSATQYDRNLNKNMPGIINDLIANLQEAAGKPHNQRRVVRITRRKVLEWSRMGVRDLADSVGLDVEDTVTRIIRGGTTLLQREDVQQHVSRAISGLVDGWRDQTIASVARQASGAEPAELAERAGEAVRRWAADAENRKQLAGAVVQMIERRATPDPAAQNNVTGSGGLGRFFPLSPAQKAMLDDYLSDQALYQISERVPELLRGLDVHSMVVNKINALDVKSVEQLLLMVIAKHLKWINLFGAILGALIGGIQILLGTFT